ncbi:hypothetical protein [Paramuribaculum intestinale]|uniref:hypothetical protein n=1 Tax=Paramuribaculum intestinale TaxID=2094151 RepID=UPI0025A9550D|nr:hypothetical protein [Paramuribaculum intestinale]
MTFNELNCKLMKAHVLMGVGTGIGAALAEAYGLRSPLIIGVLTGLLFSMQAYRPCVRVLIADCKRLKSKQEQEDEKKDIS